MVEEWQNNIESKPKLRLYKELKQEFTVESYVIRNIPKNIRSIFAQFRIGILPLHIETGRFVNIVDSQTGRYRKTNVEERLCKLCNSQEVEDEKHFIFECNLYRDERHKLHELCSDLPEFTNYSEIDKLKYFNKYEWRFLANYIYEIWQKRKGSEYLVI